MSAIRKGSHKPACHWCFIEARLRARFCVLRPTHWWHRTSVRRPRSRDCDFQSQSRDAARSGSPSHNRTGLMKITKSRQVFLCSPRFPLGLQKTNKNASHFSPWFLKRRHGHLVAFQISWIRDSVPKTAQVPVRIFGDVRLVPGGLGVECDSSKRRAVWSRRFAAVARIACPVANNSNQGQGSDTQ